MIPAVQKCRCFAASYCNVSKRLLWILLLSAVLLAVCGCSRQTRHQMLTFFFTGVPPLEEAQPNQAGAEPKEQRVTTKQVSQVVSGLPAPVSGETAVVAVPQAPRFYSHQIWLEGNCGACHAGERTFGFQAGGTAVRTQVTRVFNSGGGMPGALKDPKNKLCLTCHTDKTGLRAIKDSLWLHNTTAKGDCLACHDAHQGRYRGILRQPPDQICQTCHPEEKLAAIPMHRSSSQPCLTCHNPHMGKDRRLLTREYQEIKVPSRREP